MGIPLLYPGRLLGPAFFSRDASRTVGAKHNGSLERRNSQGQLRRPIRLLLRSSANQRFDIEVRCHALYYTNFLSFLLAPVNCHVTQIKCGSGLDEFQGRNYQAL